MNNRKFKSDKQQLIDEGQRIVSSSDDAKFLRKVTLVLLMLNGVQASFLSNVCGETVRTLTLWVKAVDEQGYDSLRPKKQPGRPSRLNDGQKEKIKVAVASDPQDYGYTVWDGPTLSDYISSAYGVVLGARQCQRMLHALGFSLIRPQTFPSKGSGDDPRRQEFKKNSRN